MTMTSFPPQPLQSQIPHSCHNHLPVFDCNISLSRHPAPMPSYLSSQINTLNLRHQSPHLWFPLTPRHVHYCSGAQASCQSFPGKVAPQPPATSPFDEVVCFSFSRTLTQRNFFRCICFPLFVFAVRDGFKFSMSVANRCR